MPSAPILKAASSILSAASAEPPWADATSASTKQGCPSPTCAAAEGEGGRASCPPIKLPCAAGAVRGRRRAMSATMRAGGAAVDAHGQLRQVRAARARSSASRAAPRRRARRAARRPGSSPAATPRATPGVHQRRQVGGHVEHEHRAGRAPAPRPRRATRPSPARPPRAAGRTGRPAGRRSATRARARLAQHRLVGVACGSAGCGFTTARDAVQRLHRAHERRRTRCRSSGACRGWRGSGWPPRPAARSRRTPRRRRGAVAVPGARGAQEVVELGAAGQHQALGRVAAQLDQEPPRGLAEDRGAVGPRAVGLVRRRAGTSSTSGRRCRAGRRPSARRACAAGGERRAAPAAGLRVEADRGRAAAARAPRAISS